MTEIRINLNTIDKVKEFVNLATKFACDLDLTSENRRYIIDAKSIMGIFSLDLSNNLTLVIHSEKTEEVQGVIAAVKEFIV